ncbi:hypothetical protein [Gluconobacter oxydans]|uniref:hypothetical protein n=1 Tax=Gluconobacter oxydans TaxID=442 RepID=UPI002647DA9C|nr:hypothetical protein [Gluconobacter oxydans]WKE49060.1 YhcN/YlaJ family sporulation lipoprotein [Gluconobacter oxydans]
MLEIILERILTWDMVLSNLDEIADVIGVEKACLLARKLPKRGGRVWLYIPAKPDRESIISEIIGYDGMALLCSELGGLQITLGDPDVFERIQNYKTAIQNGKRIRDARLKFGVPRSTAYKIMSQMRTSAVMAVRA